MTSVYLRHWYTDGDLNCWILDLKCLLPSNENRVQVNTLTHAGANNSHLRACSTHVKRRRNANFQRGWFFEKHISCFLNLIACLFAEYRISNTVLNDNQWFIMIKKNNNYNSLYNWSNESICLKVLLSMSIKIWNSVKVQYQQKIFSLFIPSQLPCKDTPGWILSKF